MDGMHTVGGHILKDKYQIFVLCMMCILKSSYNVVRIICVTSRSGVLRTLII